MSNLKVKKVWDWFPKQFDEIIKLYSRNQGEIKIDEALSALRKDRESYPEWIICPNFLRLNLIVQIYIFWFLIPDISRQ